MKCANAQISFTFGVMFTAFAAAFAFVSPAAAQLPVATATAPIASPAAPAAPVVPGVKEVSPLGVPSQPPLALDSGLDDGLGADEELDVPGMPQATVAPGGNTLGGATMPRRAPGQQLTAGAGATPANANIPSAVTDVVSDLKRAEKNVTLEDVARAQDALARLDLLLDIEKKINEIERTRDERKNIGKSFSRDSASSGIGQIPASALNLPLGGSGSPFRAAGASTPVSAPKPMVVTPAPAPRASADGFKVERISGSNGRYRAVIADNGKKTTVNEGEKFGGFTVSKISATGVTLTNDKDRKVLNVESDSGVPMVVRPR